MKITAILGSPRLNGNSAFIANRFLETAERCGAKTQSFVLNRLSFRGCQACRTCKKTSETCILKDDLTQILDAVREADIIVFASPVYFGDITAQMKTFIDRTYSFLTPEFYRDPAKGSRLLPGKTAVWIMTQGLQDDSFTDVYPRYAWVMSILGIHNVHLIRGCGLSKQADVHKRPDVLKQTEDLATHLMNRDRNEKGLINP